MIIYYPQFRLKKAQKHTQQQKNVVAGKNLPYASNGKVNGKVISDANSISYGLADGILEALQVTYPME